MNRARLFFLGLLLVAASLPCSAQTGTSDSATTATTNAPDLAPTPPAPADSSPGQVLTPGGMLATPSEIEDIRPPIFYHHSWLWLWIALAAAAFIALVIVLWRWFKPEKWFKPRSTYELTLENLEKARALLNAENPMPYAVFISETIRSYLSQRFHTSSTRRTTEEFLRLMENDRGTPLAAYRDLLRDFLRACDLVKFGRYQPELSELEQVQQRALTFVTATRPAPTPDEYNRSQA